MHSAIDQMCMYMYMQDYSTGSIVPLTYSCIIIIIDNILVKC